MRVISIKNYSDDIRVIIQLMQYHNKVSSLSSRIPRKTFSMTSFSPPGLSTKYPFVGLETGWRCHLSSRVEVGFYRTELSGARILNNDGESLRYAILQNRKFPRTLFNTLSVCHHKHTQVKHTMVLTDWWTQFSVMRRKSGMIICGARVWKCTRRHWVRRSSACNFRLQPSKWNFVIMETAVNNSMFVRFVHKGWTEFLDAK